MLGFDKKSMWGAHGQRTAPDLYGASGSGLWRYGRRISDDDARPRLAAIATEWHPKGEHRYLLGTRVPLVIEAIADRHESVREFVAERLDDRHHPR
jgi:hypothetical protein